MTVLPLSRFLPFRVDGLETAVDLVGRVGGHQVMIRNLITRAGTKPHRSYEVTVKRSTQLLKTDAAIS